MPKSKVQIDPLLERRYADLRADCQAVADALTTGAAGGWMLPGEDWAQDLDDWADLGNAFDRKTVDEQLTAAHKEGGEESGTVGDAVAGSLQIELLSQLERATRSRHCYSLPRTLALHAGRLKGHALPNGVLGQGHVHYLRNILQEGAQ